MNNFKYKSFLSSEHLYLLLIIFLFLGYFFLGIKIYKDYTISIDEPNQIVAGHITWETICEHLKLGSNPQFSELPKLEEYENRFYGQAATFPTVLVELINNFSMDISNILRLRHLWNFIMFYFGTICLACLIMLEPGENSQNGSGENRQKRVKKKSPMYQKIDENYLLV